MPPPPPAAPSHDKAAAGHLPLSLLRQYVAGTLPAAEQHRIEAHTLACARCHDVLEGLALSDAATTEAALATLRTRLHQRVAQEAEPRRGTASWRAVAAVLLVLAVSTMAWFGLRPNGKSAEEQEVAVATPARPAPPVAAPETLASGAMDAAASPPAAAGPEMAGSETASAVAPARAPAPVADRRPARRRALAAKRPARPAATGAAGPVAAGKAAAPVALNEASAQAAPTPAAGVAAAQAPPTAADAPQPDTVTVGSIAAKADLTTAKTSREEGAARPAKLPMAVTVSPQPVGGYGKLREYLRREIDFRPEPPAKGLDGSVRLQFTVTAAGKLENFRVLRSLRPDYDAEAIRLICEGPAWQSGVANGRRADLAVEISVSF
ncbi:energy transducer TonB [Hymenobacter daecheongensis]|uniref:energy transducer TonB n=1 Tax=Hymenobacter daecheongensis TaxID=496053 RepID=UPI0013565DEF|nr:energy transducer TonB [Hymenobacter daecheongensis]